MPCQLINVGLINVGLIIVIVVIGYNTNDTEGYVPIMPLATLCELPAQDQQIWQLLSIALLASAEDSHNEDTTVTIPALTFGAASKASQRDSLA